VTEPRDKSYVSCVLAHCVCSCSSFFHHSVEDCLYLFGVWILRSALLRSTTLNPVDHLEHLISKVNWVNFEINSVLHSLLLVFVEKVLTCLFTPPLGNFQTRRQCVWASAATENIHTLQDNPILQARTSTVEGGSSTLGVNYTFGEVRPSLGRRCGWRISTLKDDISTTAGPSPPGSSPGIRLKQTARLATPRPRPAVPRRHQPSLWPRQLNSGVGSASERPGQAPADHIFFSKPTLPLSVLTPLPPASAHQRAAEGFL
jgi:hypothetical protein